MNIFISKIILLSVCSACLLNATNTMELLELTESEFKNKNIAKSIENVNKSWYLSDMAKSFERSKNLTPEISKIIQESGVPDRFIFMAFQESEFNQLATSRTKAAGIWQFMPVTGIDYGLEVSEFIDERRDPLKSTRSAMRYLTDLHKHFKKWHLAIMAYNCGQGKLNRVIKYEKSDNFNVLMRSKKLPKETKEYVSRIVAFSVSSESEGSPYKSFREPGNSLMEVKFSSNESLVEVAVASKLSIGDIKRINSHLKRSLVPADSDFSLIYIPKDNYMDFVLNYHADAVDDLATIHVVESGDSLEMLGRLYGVDWRSIESMNNIKGSELKVNSKLIISRM